MSPSSRIGGRTCTHPEVDDEAPREPVRRNWKMEMDKTSTFTLPSCAVSFTCSPFTCRPPLPLGLQVSNVQQHDTTYPTLALTMDKIKTFTMDTFTLPFFVAPNTSTATFCAKSFTCVFHVSPKRPAPVAIRNGCAAETKVARTAWISRAGARADSMAGTAAAAAATLGTATAEAAVHGTSVPTRVGAAQTAGSIAAAEVGSITAGTPTRGPVAEKGAESDADMGKATEAPVKVTGIGMRPPRPVDWGTMTRGQ